ncbi:hypothetical protein VPNG_01885 [Cytospora leucostoma]|uniref:Nab2-like CCCH zinc finger domain-containing protein n=1 Tax=Cytospora leucostoma TaxID=1230097 RepID=A0A423XIH7_9PEZI|nr:hypothetical protein VPNG_01885 [Cytospora leucostoma]
MPVAVELNTPLADALSSAIQPKLEQYGWATGGADDAALTEYIILMLVNGKTQGEVTGELSADLLGLDPNDPDLLEFSAWLFATIELLAVQFGSSNAQADVPTSATQGDSTAGGDQDMEMDTPGDGPGELNVPTGPKAMRNGADRGRGKRLVGQLNRAMDRTHENALHRVRGGSGNERINSHNRAPPTGPRMGAGRLPRAPNQRAASIAHGLANMNGMPPGAPGAMGPMNGWGMMPGQPPQMDVMHMLEAQQQMLNQMQQQLMLSQGGNANGGFNGQGRGKSLFDRTQHPNQRGNFRGRGAHHQNGRNNSPHPSAAPKNEANASTEQGEDADMAGITREPANPDDAVCKYNLHCTNKECKFAHQSPAAPPGATVDPTDVCSFGAACKNFKCVGRHPSPATKTAHQSEQDCKFWPNCQNPRCPFRHPSKPPCRNGADCKTPGCEFYHNTVLCKFRPCTNRYCQFKHEDGQRGAFPDKVWTADKANEHVSERKFADDKVDEEAVIPGAGAGAGDDAMGGTEQTTVAG